ncbi:hypothetical protein Bpfe_025158 [Biomphalaria pfeifferi]|uniref:Uncharacterized protein n=1 Tax=Biomphalaria pfeifferi TaxID=112525 RepID=A0AAD8AZU9_BIOPF|nr:hypothetical protein Bpfe_025158 [Biomphalaria pfeifferi]
METGVTQVETGVIQMETGVTHVETGVKEIADAFSDTIFLSTVYCHMTSNTISPNARNLPSLEVETHEASTKTYRVWM